MQWNPLASLQFVINASAGAHDIDAKCAVIEAALLAHDRQGDLLVCQPAELQRVATEAAAIAVASGSAVIAVGGDGSLNTVAQAAHAAGCPMGVIPYGTFNYFARTHGIPTDPAVAAHWLMGGVLAKASTEQLRIVVVHQPVAVLDAADKHNPAAWPRAGHAGMGCGRG